MTQWQDEGILLNLKAFGEKGRMVGVLTKNHGLVRGFLGRGASKRLDLGVSVWVTWTARLEHQLGTVTLEALASPHIFRGFDFPDQLTEVVHALGFLQKILPERHPYPTVWETFAAMLKALGQPEFAYHHVLYQWELLKSLGYGLDLRECALSQHTQGLTHVSPKTGRAVCGAFAQAYLHRLIPLPPFLLQADRTSPPPFHQVSAQEVEQGRLLVRFFSHKHLEEMWGSPPLSSPPRAVSQHPNRF